MAAAATGAGARKADFANLWLIAPAVLVIGFFLVAPIGVIAVYSFLTPGAYGGVVWEFSAAAYVQFLFERDLFTEAFVFSDAYLLIYGRSFLQALAAMVACFLIGFPTAYFIATRPEATRTAWVFLITVPYWVNLLIRTISMLFILRDEGPLNAALQAIGVVDAPVRIAYTDFAIGVGLVYSYLPFMVLPIYAAIERFDFGQMEAARDLYAGRWAALWRVLLPAVRPGVIAGCLLVFVPSLGAFLAPDLLGGGKNLMIGNLIALQFQGSRNWPFGAAAAIILLVFVMAALLLFVRAQRRAAGAR